MRLFFAILFISSKLLGATYYVKLGGGTGTGLDSNSNAWSYAKLNATNVSGNTVLFRSGETFTGPVLQYPNTTYGTYGGNGNAKISGFTTLSSWTLSSGNIYYASLSFSQVQVVTLDGVLKGPGRYPNTGYLTYTSHSGNSSITGTSIGGLPTTYVGGEVVIKKYRYILDRHKITAQSGNTITFTADNFYGTNSNYEPTDGNGYFVQNHLSTLDQDGEWYYDATNSRLYMHFGTGTPSGRVVKVATVQKLADENSVSGLVVNNIDFEGGVVGIYHVGSTGTSFNNCNFRYFGTAVYGVDCSNISITNCTFTDCGSNAFFLEANGTGITFTGNTTNRIGLIPGLGESGDQRYSAVGVAATNFTASYNIVKNTGFNGIGFDGNNILVYRNYVDSFNILKDDGGGIYTFANNGVTRFNQVIRGNIVTNAIGNAEGAGANGDPGGEAAAIYLDGYSNHYTVDSNFCAGGPWMGIFLNANSFHTITNNTTFDFPMGIAINQVSTSGVGSVRGVSITGNKYIARAATQLAMFVNIIGTADSVSNFGTFNNNYYARPVDDNLTIQLSRSFSGVTSLVNLAGWKTMTGVDAASNKSLVSAGSVSDLTYRTNPTTSTVPVGLTAVYKNIINSSFPGSVSLSPYTGEALIYYSVLPPTSNPGSLIIRFRKVEIQRVP